MSSSDKLLEIMKVKNLDFERDVSLHVGHAVPQHVLTKLLKMLK
jgi:hypothetical protein